MFLIINLHLYYSRELEMEVGLLNRKSESEIMMTKPKVVESNDSNSTNTKLLDRTEDIMVIDPNGDNGGNEASKEVEQETESTKPVTLSALPPPEMFEIRNSPPLPFVGNKKLKKLMEKNKK